MAKIRREKDIISRTVDRYVKATTEDYVKYWEGSPTYITYYQLDEIASTQDTNLENVHSLTGPNTPNKYKKIEDVVVYNVDAYDISNQLEEQGLRSAITGEFIFLPDSLKPFPGDFFSFDYDGMREHIFRIDDVQFDRATAKKFYRVSFAIYPDAPDFTNINTDGYVMEYSNIGGQEVTILKKTDAVHAEKLKLLVDGLIDKYTKTYYDEDMDCFTFVTADPTIGESISIWSAYLQKFMKDNAVLSKYKRSLLEEIYITDISERDLGYVYSELAYRESIFRKVELQDRSLSFNNTFASLSRFDMKNTRNLPFFHIPRIYRALELHRPEKPEVDFHLDIFHLLFQEPTESFALLPDHKKFKEPDFSDVDTTKLFVGDVIYQVSPTNPLKPINIYLIDQNPTTNETEAFSISFKEIIRFDYEWLQYFDYKPFLFIRDYLNNTLSIDEEKLLEINNMYFEISLRNYIFMPILIYVLKQKINEVYEN